MNKVSIKYFQAESTAASITGPAIDCPADGRLSLDTTWTGDTAGTLALQSSQDGTNWSDVPDSSTEWTQPAGVAQSTPITCNWVNVPGKYWRVTYTRTGGTGTITINATQGDAWNF